MNRKNLRTNSTQIKLLGESITDEHLSIKGNKLPNTKQVLMSYLSARNQVRRLDNIKQSKIGFKSKLLVIKEIQDHYNKAGIKVKSSNNIIHYIETIHKQYLASVKNGKLVHSLQLVLMETCPLWDKGELENL